MSMRNLPSGMSSAHFVIDFSVAPVCIEGHGLEEADAADGRIQAVTSGPADYEGNPGPVMDKEGSNWQALSILMHNGPVLV